MGSSVQKQRDAGRGQSLFREVNERITDVSAGATTEVLCECGTGQCTETIVVVQEEYEAIREVPEHFLVVASHVRPDVERVVDDHGSFVIVEKIGVAGEVARALDPRDD